MVSSRFLEENLRPTSGPWTSRASEKRGAFLGNAYFDRGYRVTSVDVPWPQTDIPYLRELRLANVRRFERLTLPLNSPTDGRGQWIVLLGENGTGKTTLLRAIALALLRDDIASALLTQSSADAPLIRAPSGNGPYGQVRFSICVSDGRCSR